MKSVEDATKQTNETERTKTKKKKKIKNNAFAFQPNQPRGESEWKIKSVAAFCKNIWLNEDRPLNSTHCNDWLYNLLEATNETIQLPTNLR